MPQNRVVPVLQVSGTQPAVTHRPEPLQVCVAAQPPQSIARPQPLPTLPQYFPDASWQASGTQLAPPTQTPASHTSPLPHMPQSMVPKQPLPMTPQ